MPQTRAHPRKSPRQERSRQTVEAILAATAHILAAKGYEQASTNAIADRAGVSIGSLYQYFPNKESLVTAVIEQVYESDKALIEASLSKHRDKSFEKVVTATVDALLTAFSKNPRLRKVIFYETPQTRQMDQLHGTKDYVAELLGEYLERRGLVHERANLKLFLLVNALEGALYAAVRERMDARAIKRELTTLIIRYLKPANG